MARKRGVRGQKKANGTESETAFSDDGGDESAPSYQPFNSPTAPLAYNLVRKGSFATLRDSQGHEMIRFVSENGQRTWELHSSIFEPDSTLFAAMFEYGRHGSDDELAADPSFGVVGLERIHKNEYQLHNVDDFAFESFLWAVRPKLGREVPLDRLCHILILATDWQFTDIAAFARREIPKFSMDPIVQIKLARRTSIDSWLLDPYIALAVRLAPIEKDEVRILRLETTNAITRARERILHRRLALVRGTKHAAWMGVNFLGWHNKCWSTLVEAWTNAVSKETFRSLTPEQAMMAALAELKSPAWTKTEAPKSLCKTCDNEKLITAWLDCDQDTRLAEKTLKEVLGKDTTAWLPAK